jgi:hypothetical protein
LIRLILVNKIRITRKVVNYELLYCSFNHNMYYIIDIRDTWLIVMRSKVGKVRYKIVISEILLLNNYIELFTGNLIIIDY